jgi:hypothetical protein
LHNPARYSPLYVGGIRVGCIATHLGKVMDRVAEGDVIRAGDGWWVQGGDEVLDRIASRLADEGFIPRRQASGTASWTLLLVTRSGL